MIQKIAMRVSLLVGSFLLITHGAHAQLTALVLSGDLAPGTGGGTYASLADPSMNDAGTIAFSSALSGGSTIGGVFIESATGSTAVALRGDPAPGAAGATFQNFSGIRINASEEVIFQSSLSGGSIGAGIFLYSGGTLSPIVLSGDTAPGTGGATYNVPASAGLSDAGSIVFTSLLNGGTTSEGVFRVDSGLIGALAVTGGPVPGISGALFADFNGASISPAGAAVFNCTVSGPGLFAKAIFSDRSGLLASVVIEGDSAPGTGGGFFDQLSPYVPRVSSTGGLLFLAGFSGGSIASAGFFLDELGFKTPIVFVGDPAPGAPGASFTALPAMGTVNGSGEIAFRAQVEVSAGGGGIFLATDSGISSVAALGDFAPGTGTGIFNSFRNGPSINSAGDIAFAARANFGTASSGIWFLPEPSFAASVALGVLGLAATRGRYADSGKAA